MHKGANPIDYPHVYLVTSPRLLNYKFSPASWWFLYNPRFELSAMIAEVNNTFDERRLYFLDGSQQPNDHSGSDDQSQPVAGSDSTASENIDLKKQNKFMQSFAKDFHVSPFSSRKGGYKVESRDPLNFPPPLNAIQARGNKLRMRGAIDTTATLSSSKGRAKLVARLYSDFPPIDAAEMSIAQKVIFLLSWWWVGLITCE